MMRWNEINKFALFEALDQTIILEAYKKCKIAIRKFVDEEVDTYKSFIDKDGVFERMANLENEAKAYFDESNWKDYDKVRDRISNIFSDIDYHKPQISEEEKDEFVHKFLHTIELVLQDVAREDVESKYGKIENYPPYGADFDDITKRNLYFLQHIIVQIETKATQYGKPRDGGAYFRDMIGTGGDGIDFTTPYAKNVDFSHFISSGIKIFSSAGTVWAVMKDEFIKKIQEDFMGEATSYDNLLGKFLKSILSSYVHEYVHMMQYVEKNIAADNTKNPNSGQRTMGRGMTYIPKNVKRKLNKWVYDPKTKTGKNKDVRVGKRGQPDYLSGDAEPPSTERYESYFGTAHEIEAHAAGTAADMVAEFLNDREQYRGWSSSKYSIGDMNAFIDDAIEGIKYGYGVDSNSFNSYQNIIKSNIAAVDHKIGEKLPKADILHRKVWRLYMTKLVKALLVFKKPIPKEDEY